MAIEQHNRKLQQCIYWIDEHSYYQRELPTRRNKSNREDAADGIASKRNIEKERGE